MAKLQKRILKQPLKPTQPSIAIIGGGVAGSTIALRFAELGLDTTLIEKGPSLVNGPPICHLHAGGNLYREISDEQCLKLLQQSIDTVKVYPHSVNVRPTIIALPKTDKGSPDDLRPRLDKLQRKYAALVENDPTNKVLGEPDEYFKFYSREEIDALVGLPIPKQASQPSDWLISFANYTQLDNIQFPILLVQEYGLSAFRFAAIAMMAIENLPNCVLQTHTQVASINEREVSGWTVLTQHKDGPPREQHFDYVINACGFRSGEIDDMVSAKRQRLVEFKAAYVAHWPQCEGLWPEIIFHGERGTPRGMAQLTPYPDGYFQLHGMTHDITLFDNGLVESSDNSAQPQLESAFIEKIDKQWPQQVINKRTERSIEHLAQFIPDFSSAKVASQPMFGAQQIPGQDPDLRAADVSFDKKHYARAEIVKASSALSASDAILANLAESGLLGDIDIAPLLSSHYFPVSQSFTEEAVTEYAVMLAEQRNYSTSLAKTFKGVVNG